MFWLRAFRFLLIVLGVVFLYFLSYQPLLTRFSGGVGIFLLIAFFWMFAGLCWDIHQIRERLGSIQFEYTFQDLPASQPQQVSPLSNIFKTPFSSLSIRKLGDRVFKADETRTCTSCQQYESEKGICGLDGESLAGITIAAVGCQHWSPNLTVTEGSLASDDTGEPDESSTES